MRKGYTIYVNGHEQKVIGEQSFPDVLRIINVWKKDGRLLSGDIVQIKTKIEYFEDFEI